MTYDLADAGQPDGDHLWAITVDDMGRMWGGTDSGLVVLYPRAMQGRWNALSRDYVRVLAPERT